MWRVFICVLVLANLVSRGISQCDPSLLDSSFQRGSPCPDTIPIHLTRDTLGIQLTTTLGNCTDNRYDILQIALGIMPEVVGGDYLEYAVLWDQPDTFCSIDLYVYNFTSGVGNELRALNIPDQYGLSPHPLIVSLITGYILLLGVFIKLINFFRI
jgi:hypothetical protein